MASSAKQAVAPVIDAHRQGKQCRRPLPGTHGRQWAVEHRCAALVAQDLEGDLVAEIRRHGYARAAAAEHVVEPVLGADMRNPVARQREAPGPAMGDAHAPEFREALGEITEDAPRLLVQSTVAAARAGAHDQALAVL